MRRDKVVSEAHGASEKGAAAARGAADMVKMASRMANATSGICPNGSHLAMWDDQAVYFRYLLGFLRSLSS
jgi:pimeloyl-ACP methyl ester carboxylesterase